MGRKEVRSGLSVAPERMPTVPEATKSKEIGVKTAILLTPYPEKNGDAAEANQ